MFDDDARLPGRTELLQAGRRVPALIRIALDGEGRDEISAIRTVCVKLPGVYGPGRDQDVPDLVVGDVAEIGSVALDARNSGGGIRPLPPVMFYRG